MVTGAAVGGLAGSVVAAAVGGVGGAAAGFLLDLATRAFNKDRKAKKTRAELFVRIAQKL
jgi:outer membrane lipoprotein SlyB